MDFFSTDVYLPVDRQRFEVTTETPRHPTAFEWAAARIVADFQGMEQFAAASVGDVFRTALGGEGSEAFLRTALDELFSSMVHVLETDEVDVDPVVLPLSKIRLTQEGRRLLETGLLPSEPQLETREVFYDPIGRAVLPKGVRMATEPDPEPKLDLDGRIPLPPVDEVRSDAERKVRDGSRVGNVNPVGAPRRQWRHQRLFFSLDDGKVRLTRERGELAPSVADYIEALSADRVKESFFSKAFDGADGFPSVATTLPEDVTRVLPPSSLAGESPRISPVVFTGRNCVVPGFEATALVVEPGDGLMLSGNAGEVLRLTVPSAGYPVPEGGVCDRDVLRAPLLMRCFYAGLPMELPVVYEQTFGQDGRQRLADYLKTWISGLPASDRCRVEFLLADNHEARRQAVAALIAATSGDERVSSVSAQLKDVHGRDGYQDLHAVVDGVFGMPGLAGFKDVEEAEELLARLPFTAEETRWANGHLNRYRKGLARAGEAPENEFVWIETSSKGRPGNGRRHGRKGGKVGKRH